MLTSIIRSLPSLRSFRAVTGIREWSSEIEEYVASVAQPQTGPAVSTVAGQAVNYTPYAERLEQLLNTPLQLGASSDEATQAEKDVSGFPCSKASILERGITIYTPISISII